MVKTITTIEILNIYTWYKNLRNNPDKPLNVLPLAVQWKLKKNIAKISTVADNFLSLREEAEADLQNQFMSDEKSYDKQMEDGTVSRLVREEFLDEFRDKANEVNAKLNEICDEKNDIDIDMINIDEIITMIPEDQNVLTIDDIEMLDFMDEASQKKES